MNRFQSRQLPYDIEPWLEQPSQIPIRFMTSTNFAKPSKSPQKNVALQENMQIGINSVYFIKNNQEEKPGKFSQQKTHPRTTPNSPKMRPTVTQNDKDQLKIYKNLSTHSHFVRKSKQRSPVSPDGMGVTHSTKNLVFQIKRIKKSDKQILNRSKSKEAKNSKEGFKSNLLEMYKRSTMLSQKDKHEEDSRKDENVRTILAMSNENNEQTKMGSPKSGLKSELSVALNSGGYQKRQFYLMVERKLFMLKNNFIMGQSNSKRRINSSKNIKK